MAQIIDGVAVAKKLREQIAAEIADLKLRPGLAVILVGDNPASQVYVRNKAKACEAVGIHSITHALPTTTTEAELLNLIVKLNASPEINGILVQLPLPEHIHDEAVVAAIDPTKDVDGFHPINIGKLVRGVPCFVPCTPQGCMLLLKEVLPDLRGLRALVVGRSNIVGKPVAQLLINADCTVTCAHSKTRDLPSECRRADILVAALGKPKFIQGDWIKTGAVVIDVGINRGVPAVGKAKLIGDVDFAAASERAAAITPVPGGVGPMTIACLLRNTLQATRIQRCLP